MDSIRHSEGEADRIQLNLTGSLVASLLGMTSLPHCCIADGIRDERERYRPFFGGVDVGYVERIEAVGHLLVRMAELVLATARDDGVCGGDGVQER